MQTRKLSLINFRKFDSLDLEFKEGLNLILGDNGTGKTSILEAIQLTSSARSFRKSSDQEMLKENTQGYNIKLEYLDDDISHKIEYQYSDQKKKIFYDDELLPKASDLVSKFQTTIYTPLDVYIFSRTPEDRRNLFDEILIKVSDKHLYSLKRYKDLLKKRNNLLQDSNSDQDMIKLYGDELIAPGFYVMEERRALTIYINKKITYYYNLLFNFGEEKNKLKLTYVNPLKTIMDYEVYLSKMRQILKENISNERIRKRTLFGSHLDNFVLTIDNKNVEDYQSQGQNKIATIALKLSLIDFIRERTNKEPVLILDDIFSDLDKKRCELLLERLKQLPQVILSSTSYPSVLDGCNLIEIKNEQGE